MRSTMIILAALLLPLTAAADVTSDVQIRPDGTVIAKNVLVMQKSEREGSNLFVRATWGEAFVRMTLIVNASTKITKEYGEPSKVSDIQVGDRLDVEGRLTSGADTILFTPTKIVDHALQVAEKTFSGTIQSIDAEAQRFVLKDGKTSTTVITSGAVITKGIRTITIGELAKGDKILSVFGQYDYATQTLTASSISVYQDPKVFRPRNFEGVLRSISATALPATLTIDSGGTTYTVYLSATTSVLNKSKTPATLTRALVGDRVRFYGAIRQSNLTEIDAEILRDMAF